jgi:hypothetical protein
MVDYKNFDLEEEYTMDENNPLKSIKTDNELFKDEDYIPQKLIQIKRSNKKNIEEWKILEDSKVAMLIPATRLNNKQKEYFRSAEGFLYLIEGYKKGWRAVNKFKKGIK